MTFRLWYQSGARGDPPFDFFPFGRFGRGGWGNPGWSDRPFGRGDLKYVILELLKDQPRHGYDIARLIDERSDGVLQFHVASLYPLLYRMEKRGWIKGQWIEKPGQRRRRYYRLTPEGRRVLARQRDTWQMFFAALNRVARIISD